MLIMIGSTSHIIMTVLLFVPPQCTSCCIERQGEASFSDCHSKYSISSSCVLNSLMLISSGPVPVSDRLWQTRRWTLSFPPTCTCNKSVKMSTFRKASHLLVKVSATLWSFMYSPVSLATAAKLTHWYGICDAGLTSKAEVT